MLQVIQSENTLIRAVKHLALNRQIYTFPYHQIVFTHVLFIRAFYSNLFPPFWHFCSRLYFQFGNRTWGYYRAEECITFLALINTFDKQNLLSLLMLLLFIIVVSLHSCVVTRFLMCICLILFIMLQSIRITF